MSRGRVSGRVSALFPHCEAWGWRSLADLDEHHLQLLLGADATGLQQEGRLVGVVPNDVIVHPNQDAAKNEARESGLIQARQHNDYNFYYDNSKRERNMER